MSESSVSKEDGWPVPVLDRAGQQTFWDRQVLGYDQADMTRDNGGELDLVRALCQQFCLSGYQAKDVVALGGAVGSRDPKVVMEILERHGKSPKSIYFNDLSELMTKQAFKTELSAYSEKGIGVVLLPGPIHEIAESIPAIPRRVVIGVYRLEAFTVANPHYGYPLTGLEEYENNANIIGTHLTIEPVRLTKDGYEGIDAQVTYSSEDSPEQRACIRTRLAGCANTAPVDAIRVIGRHKDQEGYFLSHWFTEQGIRRLVARCFSLRRISSMFLMSCAKGFVLCIDPIEQPCGVVTILNNVIGNIIPGEQMETLRAIEKLSR